MSYCLPCDRETDEAVCPECGMALEPEPPESSASSRYETVWPRIKAGVLDGFVLAPLALADGFLSSPERGALILIAWAAISYSAYWLYSVLLHARSGQTLGKRAAHVKVLDLSEERIPTLGQAFLRDSGYILLNCLSLAYFVYLVLTRQYAGDAAIAALPVTRLLTLGGLLWFLLEVSTALINPKRRALHDLIAGTVVVREA